MKAGLSRLWRLCALHPALFLTAALVLEAGAGVFICMKMQFEVALRQFMLGAQQIVESRHISSTFLPIGYSALLGFAERMAQPYGVRREHLAIEVLHVLVMVLLVVVTRAALLQNGSARFATVAALLIGLDPQMMTFVKTVSDTDLTALTLATLLLSLLWLRKEVTIGHALFAGLALGCAVLVRPNLALMVTLLLWPGRRLPGKAVVKTFAFAGATAIVTFLGVSGIVHGRPFFPNNGAYNLYAGYNAHTAENLLLYRNAENSIVPSLAEHGIHSELDWGREPDIPGVDDVRDAKYIPFYRSESRSYILHHPGEDLWLILLKAYTLMRDSYVNYDNRNAVFHAATNVVKTVGLAVIPIWLGLWIWLKQWRVSLGDPLIACMAVLYTLPFVLINSDPRFRIPLEALLMIDIARMLYLVYGGGRRSYGLGGKSISPSAMPGSSDASS